MTAIEGIIGLVASVFAIIAALAVASRYIAKRFDHWADAVVENSKAMRDLTVRVSRLEDTMRK